MRRLQRSVKNYPAYTAPQMTHAAHPVATEVPPGYDGNASWLKYSDAVEEWCDLTRVEPRRRRPAIAARLSGRAELTEGLDRDSQESRDFGVEYYLATMRPYLVKDKQAVCLYCFFQMLRCHHCQTDYRRWLIKHEIARN